MDKSEFKQEVLAHLKKSAVMALATVESGEPRVAYVLFVADADFNFYFMTRTGTAKHRSIMENNRVSLTAGIARPFNVQAGGAAHEVTEDGERFRIIKELAEVGAHLDNFWPPLLHLGDSDYAVYRIETDWVRVLDLRTSIISETKSVFSQLKG